MGAVPGNIQLVNFKGDFCETDVKNFVQDVPRDQTITVVSIIGRQGSGKSSLLNCLFETKFEELASNKNNGQTTEGVWIAMRRSKNYCIIIVDVEGSDAKKRDGPLFECRSALLALTISDVLLLNMPAPALEQLYGGCEFLLRTIFKARVSLSSDDQPNKTSVVVTLRNCNNCNDETLTEDLHKATTIMEEAWKNSVSSSDKKFDDYIEVNMVQFPDKMNNDRSKEFQKQLVQLKKLICRKNKYPLTGATFVNRVKEYWHKICDSKDLNFPELSVLITKHMLEEKIKEKVRIALSLEDFLKLKNNRDPDLQSFEKEVGVFLFSQLGNFLKESAAGSHPEEAKELFKNEFERKIAEDLKETYITKLIARTNEIVKDKKKTISTELRSKEKSILGNMFKLTRKIEAFDSVEIHGIVNRHVNECDNLLGGSSCNEFKGWIKIYTDELKQTVKHYVEKEIKKIEKTHWTYVIAGRVGVAAVVIFTGYLFYGNTGAVTGVLSVLFPTLYAGVGATQKKKCLAAFSNFLILNIIIPAAQNAIQHLMIFKKVDAKDIQNYMKNVCMAMFLCILTILSKRSKSFDSFP